MTWHSYFIEAMPFTALAVPMLFVAAWSKWPADTDTQANRQPRLTIVRYAGDWGGQKDGLGHKHQSAHSRRSQKRSRLPIVNPSALCHGFTMD